MQSERQGSACPSCDWRNCPAGFPDNTSIAASPATRTTAILKCCVDAPSFGTGRNVQNQRSSERFSRGQHGELHHRRPHVSHVEARAAHSA
jgi:hypothetical protein